MLLAVAALLASPMASANSATSARLQRILTMSQIRADTKSFERPAAANETIDYSKNKALVGQLTNIWDDEPRYSCLQNWAAVTVSSCTGGRSSSHKVLALTRIQQ
jgi:DNA primase catalytic subunit